MVINYLLFTGIQIHASINLINEPTKKVYANTNYNYDFSFFTLGTVKNKEP